MSHETNLQVLSAKHYPWALASERKSYPIKNEGLAGAGTPITQATMQHMTEIYREWASSLETDEFKMPAVVFFGKEALLSLLLKDECQGVAFTFGIYDDTSNGQQPHLTLIAAGAKSTPGATPSGFATAGFRQNEAPDDEPFWEVVPYDTIPVSKQASNIAFDFYNYFR